MRKAARRFSFFLTPRPHTGLHPYPLSKNTANTGLPLSRSLTVTPETLLEIENKDANAAQNENMPVLKFLPFPQGLNSSVGLSIRASTENSKASSRTMAELQPVDAALMKFWMYQWAY
jgi:hypothetical protein